MKWKFFIDKGGTFTDIVSISPEKKIFIHKVLSTNDNHNVDSTLVGIQEILNKFGTKNKNKTDIDIIKLGTTIGTNTLLQKNGPDIAFLTTTGFEDSVKIGLQNRTDIFHFK